jgi:hypothetical protein
MILCLVIGKLCSGSVIPPKISGAHKWKFLGIISEEILDEEQAIGPWPLRGRVSPCQPDHRDIEAGREWCASIRTVLRTVAGRVYEVNPKRDGMMPLANRRCSHR